MTVLNYPGPYQIRLKYSTTPTGLVPIQHTARYNINLTGPTPPAGGTLFSALTVIRRDGIPQTLQSYVDAWVALLRPLLASAANNTVDYAELWYYTPGTFNAQFISTYSIALAGTNAGTATGAAEKIMTFRSQEGGIMKLYFEELAASAGGVPDTPPFAVGAEDAIQVFVSGVTNAWLAADTSYPFATIALYPGQNEALFKKRFRP